MTTSVRSETDQTFELHFPEVLASPTSSTHSSSGPSGAEKRLPCEFCGRCFTNNLEWERHVLRHGMLVFFPLFIFFPFLLHSRLVCELVFCLYTVSHRGAVDLSFWSLCKQKGPLGGSLLGEGFQTSGLHNVEQQSLLMMHCKEQWPKTGAVDSI